MIQVVEYKTKRLILSGECSSTEKVFHRLRGMQFPVKAHNIHKLDTNIFCAYMDDGELYLIVCKKEN